MPPSASDPSGLPPAPGVAQLRRLIDQAAAGALSVDDLADQLDAAYEAAHEANALHYASKDEARLIWDVLWALEFYSPDPAQKENPADWHEAAFVLGEVQRVARRLRELHP